MLRVSGYRCMSASWHVYRFDVVGLLLLWLFFVFHFSTTLLCIAYSTFGRITPVLINCWLSVLLVVVQVNQCELGRPKRQLRDMGASEGGSSSLQKPTAASSRKGATGSSRPW